MISRLVFQFGAFWASHPKPAAIEDLIPTFWSLNTNGSMPLMTTACE